MQDPKDILIQRQAHRIGELVTQLEWASIQLQALQAQLQQLQARNPELEGKPQAEAQA
jgi:uncharacterized protein YPO0396